MNSQDFIKNNLDLIVSKYPFIKCTYQFDDFCNLHSVQITPKDYLNNPKGFGALQYSITKEFISLFHHERLTFFSVDNTIQIDPEKVVYQVSGPFFQRHIKEIELFPEYAVNIPNIDSLLADKTENFALAA